MSDAKILSKKKNKKARNQNVKMMLLLVKGADAHVDVGHLVCADEIVICIHSMFMFPKES